MYHIEKGASPALIERLKSTRRNLKVITSFGSSKLTLLKVVDLFEQFPEVKYKKMYRVMWKVELVRLGGP